MSIDIYWGSGSPFAWRVLLALEWKKIPYRSHLLNFSKGEHRSPEMMAMNPRGKVPVLKDGEVTLYESLAILNYLERKHPQPGLFGATAAEHGAVWREISECIYYFETPAFEMIGPIFFGGVNEKADAVKAAAEKLHAELARMEKILGSADWLAGGKPSAADLWWYPEIMLVERAGRNAAAQTLNLDLGALAPRYPAIERWRKRIETQPGYDKTYPPHWKQSA